MAKLDQIKINGTIHEIVPEIAPLFNTTTAYAAGDCVIKDAVLYRFTVAHAAGAWIGTDAEEVTVGKELTVLKADLTDISEQIVNLSQEPNLLTPISFTLIEGGYIRHSDGNVVSANDNLYTDYIDVSQLKQIVFKQSQSTSSNPSAGTAFYNSEKQYLSGIQAVKSQSSYGYFDTLTFTDIPSEAVYVRFTAWTNIETYGVFELYSVNNEYVETSKINNLFKNGDLIDNVDISKNYVDRLNKYGYDQATKTRVDKLGNHFVLDGATQSGYDLRIKISNGLERAAIAGQVSKFANPQKFKIGHEYTAVLKFDAISSDLISNVSLSVYKPGTYSSVGSLYIKNDGCARTFVADQEEYHICIYVNGGHTLNNFGFTVDVYDETGNYLSLAKTARLYTDTESGTIQCGVIYNHKIYVYESSQSGRLQIVDISSGEKTKVNLPMEHGNDMTLYNNKLYVVSMADNGRIFIVNPSTMSIESYVDFTIDGNPVVTYGIAYDAINKQFVLETIDGFAFAKTDLTYKSSVTRDYMSGSTMQGIECDGYHIYAVESTRNHIDVYDYSGKWLEEIALGSGAEPETLFNDWSGGWWLITNIPGYQWYIDAINFYDKLSLNAICSIANTFK